MVENRAGQRPRENRYGTEKIFFLGLAKESRERGGVFESFPKKSKKGSAKWGTENRIGHKIGKRRGYSRYRFI